MSEFSRAQEREEKRRIDGGMKTSAFALLLCWVPFLGVILGSVAFVRVTASITRRYQSKRRIGILLALIALILALALTTYEVYVYTHTPWVVDDARNWFMDHLTGGAAYENNYHYDAQQSPGMGMSQDPYVQGYTPDGYYNEQGELIPYAEAQHETVGENETGG